MWGWFSHIFLHFLLSIAICLIRSHRIYFSLVHFLYHHFTLFWIFLFCFFPAVAFLWIPFNCSEFVSFLIVFLLVIPPIFLRNLNSMVRDMDKRNESKATNNGKWLVVFMGGYIGMGHNYCGFFLFFSLKFGFLNIFS